MTSSFTPGRLLVPKNDHDALMVVIKEDGQVSESRYLTKKDIVFYLADVPETTNIILVIYDGIIFRTNKLWYYCYDDQ